MTDERTQHLVVLAMVRAFAELNEIRARDGVPRGSSVDEDYFSSVVDSLDEAVRSLTGKCAHCHPVLYDNGDQE